MDSIWRDFSLCAIAVALISATAHLRDIAETLKSHKPACVAPPAPKAKGMV